MKRVDLEKHLRSHGCEYLRDGGNHPIWWNPATGAITAIPPHREIDTYTARGACKQLGIPSPSFR